MVEDRVTRHMCKCWGQFALRGQTTGDLQYDKESWAGWMLTIRFRQYKGYSGDREELPWMGAQRRPEPREDTRPTYGCPTYGCCSEGKAVELLGKVAMMSVAESKRRDWKRSPGLRPWPLGRWHLSLRWKQEDHIWRLRPKSKLGTPDLILSFDNHMSSLTPGFWW